MVENNQNIEYNDIDSDNYVATNIIPETITSSKQQATSSKPKIKQKLVIIEDSRLHKLKSLIKVKE